MAAILTPDDIDWILNNAWDDLCLLAYDGFLKNGKGFLGIDRDDHGEFQLLFATVPDASTFDDKIKTIVKQYDPETEFIIHFACAEGQYRTVRLRNTAQRGPNAVWEAELAKQKATKN